MEVIFKYYVHYFVHKKQYKIWADGFAYHNISFATMQKIVSKYCVTMERCGEVTVWYFVNEKTA